MTASIDDREKAFENKFKMDEELRFKVQMRAVKLFGAWAAGQMGVKDAGAVAKYAEEVVEADFEEAGIQDVLRKVKKDLDAKGIKHELPHLEKEYNIHLAEAKRQLSTAA